MSSYHRLDQLARRIAATSRSSEPWNGAWPQFLDRLARRAADAAQSAETSRERAVRGRRPHVAGAVGRPGFTRRTGLRRAALALAGATVGDSFIGLLSPALAAAETPGQIQCEGLYDACRDDVSNEASKAVKDCINEFVTETYQGGVSGPNHALHGLSELKDAAGLGRCVAESQWEYLNGIGNCLGALDDCKEQLPSRRRHRRLRRPPRPA